MFSIIISYMPKSDENGNGEDFAIKNLIVCIVHLI
jgi:hypothetical protein